MAPAAATSALEMVPLFMVFLLALDEGDLTISTVSTASSNVSELDSESDMMMMMKYSR